MDAIIDLPPDLPPHDAAPLRQVAHRIVAEWPVGTFLENLAVLPDGAIIVSVLSEARLDRVDPDGAVSRFHQFAAPPTGLAVVDGYLFVATGEPGHGEAELWRLALDGSAAERWMQLTGIGFANGVTPFTPGTLLIAESIKGQLCRVDLAKRRVDVWLEDVRLTPAPGFEFLPGANGVKRFADEVTVSSNGRAELYRIAITADGRAGAMTRLAERCRVDDMAYDRAGLLYLTTHIGHSLDRLDRDGVRIALGGVAQGLAGSTACAFAADGSLYVTTTGGIFGPPARQPQPAKLVRLEVGAVGHPLTAPWES